jgi:hypothetical protein
LTTDPERIRASRVVSNIFKNRLVYKVARSAVQADFGLFGGGAPMPPAPSLDRSMDDLLTSLEDEEEGAGVSGEDVSAADNSW